MIFKLRNTFDRAVIGVWSLESSVVLENEHAGDVIFKLRNNVVTLVMGVCSPESSGVLENEHAALECVEFVFEPQASVPAPTLRLMVLML